MKKLNMPIAIVTVLLLALFPALSWAATATATASVSATLASICTISLTRDTSSATRGSAATIIFDKADDVDMPGDPNKSAGYMYAPYRSETDKNWHVASIAANGSNLTLQTAVTGTIGTTPLVNILKIYCGGFFEPGASNPIGGTKSSDWEFANGWQRQLSRSFVGTVSFNYQLNISSLPAGGPYTGTITFTLTST